MSEQIEHVTIICEAYNKFRKHIGLPPDYSPVEGLWEATDGKLIHYNEPEDEAEWTSTISPPISVTFEFDKCDSDDEILKKLQLFQEQVLNHKSRHWTCLNWVKDSKGKDRKWPQITNNLERCFKAIQIGQHYSTISTELDLVKNHTEQGYKSADREAVRLYKHGRLLVESAKSFDKFCKAAIKPLPRNI